MIEFLKTKIRPVFRKIGIYNRVYRLFFTFYFFSCNITNRIKRKFTKTAVILTYHRIANVSNDPHLLCVSPKYFEGHLKFLKEHYEVISLPELQNRLSHKKLTGHEAIITFDDGYRDNLTNALPLLEKYGTPATIFVTTGFLGEQASFAWDNEYLGVDKAIFLNPEEISRLAINPLITIGAHTHTHPRLSLLTEKEQVVELETCKQHLEKISGFPISLFAFPFGGIFDFTNVTKKLVKKTGFTVACTTTPKLVAYSTNLSLLPRINIRNYTIDILSKKIFYET